MRIVGITQARFGSSRLRGKVLKDISGKPMLAIHLDRLRKSKMVNDWVVATTQEPESAQIVAIAKDEGFASYQGSLHDVLDRFYQAAKPFNPDYVVRVTSDCPLIDATIIDSICKQMIEEKADYATNVIGRTFADGLDVEAFRFAALEQAWNEATQQQEREHVTLFIRNHSSLMGGNKFKSINFKQSVDESSMRLTVDYEEDLEVIRQLVKELGTEASAADYIQLLNSRSDISAINKMYQTI